jgi:mono/diheme cytochrome c family protein
MCSSSRTDVIRPAFSSPSEAKHAAADLHFMRCMKTRHVVLFAPCLCLIAAIVAAACGKSPTKPEEPTPIPPPGATVDMVIEGRGLYRTGTCTLCHGFDGKGGAGPNLTDNVFLHNSGTWEEIIAIINTGVPADKFKSPTSNPAQFMLPRGAMSLTDAQLRSLAAYVWTLSHPNG